MNLKNFIKNHNLDEKQTVDLLSYFISVYGRKLENKDLSYDESYQKELDQKKPYWNDLNGLFEHLINELKCWIIEHPNVWAKVHEIIEKQRKYPKITNKFEPLVTFRFAVDDITNLLKYGLTNNDMYIGFSVGDEAIDLQ